MGNGALWALLSDQGMKLFGSAAILADPARLVGSVAAHVNRNRLATRSSLTAIRYICVMIIYLSSAGEMFMKLVVPEGARRLAATDHSGQPGGGWYFCGHPAARSCAFLYMGASFLLLSIVAMVWNAGRLVHHTWPWWVFGISWAWRFWWFSACSRNTDIKSRTLIVRLRHWDA